MKKGNKQGNDNKGHVGGNKMIEGHRGFKQERMGTSITEGWGKEKLKDNE